MNLSKTLPNIFLILLVSLALFGCCREFVSILRNRENCILRQQSLRISLLIYASDHDDFFPNSASWQEATTPYVGVNRVNFICPIIEPQGDGVYGIAFNQNLGTRNINTIPDPSTYACVFDSTSLTFNSTSTTSTLPSPARHDKNVIFRLDGVATHIPPAN